jgi:hypothetical protein
MLMQATNYAERLRAFLAVGQEVVAPSAPRRSRRLLSVTTWRSIRRPGKRGCPDGCQSHPILPMTTVNYRFMSNAWSTSSSDFGD